jgi:DNA-binding FadR family transcriptional regulator
MTVGIESQEVAKSLDGDDGTGDLRRKVYRVVSMGITLPKYADRYLISHRLLYDAIQAGNPEAAVIAMKSHMEEQKNYLLEELSGLGR